MGGLSALNKTIWKILPHDFITVDMNEGLCFARLQSSFLWWSNDDVIKWKLFRVTGPLCGDSIGHQWIPLKRPATRSFDSFCDLHLNKRLSKQSGRRFFRRHRAYGVTVMRGIKATQIIKFMGPTWGTPGSCRPQMGPMLAPWTLLSGTFETWFLWR